MKKLFDLNPKATERLDTLRKYYNHKYGTLLSEKAVLEMAISDALWKAYEETKNSEETSLKITISDTLYDYE